MAGSWLWYQIGALRWVNGEWVEGFITNTDYGETSEVEAKAIAKGLEWAWIGTDRGLRDVEVQFGTKNVINWIKEKTELRGPVSESIEEVHRWINKNWRITIRWVYREENEVADALGTLGANLNNNGWRDLDTCPRWPRDESLPRVSGLVWLEEWGIMAWLVCYLGVPLLVPLNWNVCSISRGNEGWIPPIKKEAEPYICEIKIYNSIINLVF